MRPREGRVLLEPELRYWRWRVNRHVRRRRRLRSALRWGAAAAVNLGIAGVLALAAAGAVRHLLTSRALALQNVEVVGARRAPPEELRRTLEPLMGDNLLGLSLSGATRRIESHPWVLEAVVKRRLPGTLRVQVKERRPAALAVIGGLVQVVDEHGKVLGPFGPGLAPDLPVLTGLEGREAAATGAVLARGVELLRRLADRSPAFAARISELDLSEPDRVAVRLVEPGPTLLLDPERVDRNVDLYVARGAEVSRKLGPLRIVDLRWSGRFIVVPEEAPGPEWSD